MAGSVIKISPAAVTNAYSLCKFSGASRSSLPACFLAGKRQKNYTDRRLLALTPHSTADFFGSMTLKNIPELLSLQCRQTKRSLSVSTPNFNDDEKETVDGKESKSASVIQPDKWSSKGSGHALLEEDYLPHWGCASVRGRRPEMQDEVAVVPRLLKVSRQMLIGDHVDDGEDQPLSHLTTHFFGVYDGHGGSQVASYCRDRIHSSLAEELEVIMANLNDGSNKDNCEEQWRRAFTKCFLKVDDEIGGKAGLEPVAPGTVGSTAVAAIICSSHIIVANCGDSRAVLCRGKEAIALSMDHKPYREDELARIEAAGGRVIYWDCYRVNGILAMSRAIGDRELKPSVIPNPEVIFIPRSREDECLILASDGLWDMMTNQEACDVARERIVDWHKNNGTALPLERGDRIDPAAQAAAEYLLKCAYETGSWDNISVVVVDLKDHRK